MITKVKHSKGVTTIHWRDVHMEEVIEHEMKSSEDPRPELLTTIAAFIPFVIEICEFPKAWDQVITVSGISLSEIEINDKQMLGIVITSMKRLEMTPLPVIINTPFLVDEAWPAGLRKAVDKLESEALKFRDGDRAQQVLPGVQKKSKKQTTLVELVEKTAEHVNSGALDRDGVTVRAEVRQ